MSERIKSLAGDISFCAALLLIPAGFLVMGGDFGLGLTLATLGSAALLINHHLDE